MGRCGDRMKHKILVTVKLEYDELGYWHAELRYEFRDRGHKILGSCFGNGDYVMAWVGKILTDHESIALDAERELHMLEEDREDAESREEAARLTANAAENSGGAAGENAQIEILRIDSAGSKDGDRAAGNQTHDAELGSREGSDISSRRGSVGA